MLIAAITSLCILLYGASIFFLNRCMTTPFAYHKQIQWSNYTAVILHFVILGLVIHHQGIERLHFLTVLSIIAWLLCVFSLSKGPLLSNLVLRPTLFGFSLISLLFVCIQVQFFSHDLTSLGVTRLDTPLAFELILHIILSTLAYSLLVLAALYAIQFLYLNKVLKTRAAKALTTNLPPLLAVEHYFYRLLLAGTVVLTLAIFVGVLFVDELFATHQIHKTVLSFAAWLVFSGILAAHSLRGFRGKPLVNLTLIASTLLTLAYFGSRFVRDILL